MGQDQSVVAEQEGSARERFLENPNRIDHYIAPLLDASCPLLTQPQPVLELIFSYLSLESLADLSMTCSQLDILVGEFMRHTCTTGILFSSRERFLSLNNNLLTQPEKRIVAYTQVICICEN